ncbi:MAG: hypothetical protein ACREIF_00880 [Chthoniobacterales bacterium]
MSASPGRAPSVAPDENRNQDPPPGLLPNERKQRTVDYLIVLLAAGFVALIAWIVGRNVFHSD